jgi:sec-independent protein translocase protein TatC
MSDEKGKELTFMGHLAELISRLRIVIYALVISGIAVMVVPISFDFSQMSTANPWYQTISSFVITKIQADFLPAEVKLLPISWFAPLEVYLFVSLGLAVIVSSPVIMYQLYKFINPALHQREKRLVYPFVIAFTGLFLFGVTLGYLLVIPATIRAMVMFTELLNLTPTYAFAEFFSVVMTTLILCGFIFTFPIYVVLLIKLGIVSTEQIKKSRKYIYLGAVVLIALIDPEPSLVTEITLIIPIIVLMEISLLIGRRYEKQREQAEQQLV